MNASVTTLIEPEVVPVPGRAADLAQNVDRLAERFPPREEKRSWPTTERPQAEMMEIVLASRLLNGLDERTRGDRVDSLRALVGWLGTQPGSTWDERWHASGADDARRSTWRDLVVAIADGGPRRIYDYLGSGLAVLICADVIRPSLRWLLTSTTPRKLAASLAATRDPKGFADLALVLERAAVSVGTTGPALQRIAAIVVAKGGAIADITVGDCLQVQQVARGVFADGHYNSAFFYQLLHSTGVFGPEAPPSLRVFNTGGQRSVEDLVDRYGIACRPVRDLLVDYLRERQMRLDYSTLNSLSATLANRFWADLERHHPGIDSLLLSTEVKTAWKLRLSTKAIRPSTAEVATTPRLNAMEILSTVRAFYLDIAEWANDEPARWARWAVPSPIRSSEISHKKNLDHRKSRMDQRTRERLPILPTLAAAVDAERRAAAERLDMARGTPPGELFTTAGQTLRRTRHGKRAVTRIWAEDPQIAKRRDLTLEEHQAFWSWASVEVLRHTGIRIEELGELSHHDMIEYKLPESGELIPLLHVVPSKTDLERLLVISPELADVLSAIICRVRREDQTVPLVVAYDALERTWLPPMPLLFQRRFGAEHRPIVPHAIRQLLVGAAERAGISDASGRPLRFVPHDFRRLFITDAIMHGMPPYIAQLVAGHRDINVTMGYKAVYPEEVINGHRAFIARRRALRPSTEYRTPTEEEWSEFLGHFEHRRLSLGTCGRSYATPCIHEHSCIRCPLLRPDPVQRPRLIQIEANLSSRIDEAIREGWPGEADGLRISQAAAQEKLAQMDQIAAHQQDAVHLGMPGFARTAARTVTTGDHPTQDGSPR
ncbi:MAG: tyrosine-type recombinase/integrase [Acidimicrobiales bacterium]